MSEIVLDECLFYLREAENYLSLYKEMDPFQEIFETFSPETQLNVEQNEKAKTGVKGSLTKACQAVMKAIQNIIDSIKDFFAKRNLDEKSREAYEKFKEAAKNNPELKNKKITVQDFTKINNEYNKLLEEAREADKQLALDNQFNTDKIIQKISSFCGGAAKGVAVSVGAEAAMNIASSSRQIAKQMYSSLKNDKDLENQLIEAIGKKETKRYEKQMKSLGKRISLHRAVMKMKGTYSKSVEGAIDNTFDSLFDLFGAGAKAVDINSQRTDDPITKSKFQNAKAIIGLVKNNKNDIKDIAKTGLKNSDLIRRTLGNKQIHQGIATGMDISNQSVDDAKEMYDTAKRNAKKRRPPKKKKLRHVHDQSAMDSLFAANDPYTTSNGIVRRVKKAIKRRIN